MPAITLPQGLEQAGTVITNVRDVIPDPVYTAGGVAQPDVDGSFVRAQTLYRFLNNGLRELTRRTNWLVEDWWAMPLAQKQPLYALDARWHQPQEIFVNQYRCWFLDEPLTIYPSASTPAGSQSVTAGWHKRAGLVEISLYPAPGTSDPVTTLSAAVTTTVQDTLALASSLNFLSYGWVQIDDELLHYANLGTNLVSVLRRGAAGTTAATHLNGATVRHCGLWVKGIRTPNPVSVSTDLLEIPLAFVSPLELYVLARVREAEQSRAEAQSLMQEFWAQCDQIMSSPQWQNVPAHTQIPAYGSRAGGGLGWWDGMDGVIVR
jgi:hypothetical protein